MLVNNILHFLSANGRRFGADTRAVTAIEYALIAALIAVVIIGAVTSLGTGISNTFNTVASEL
jgi:pilus assembly protein Flp/PilA